MANDYTSSTDAFADISEGTYASSDFPQMATMVTVASRLIDKELGVWDGFFYPSTDTVTRYYDGSGEIELDIDPFTSITTVSVSEQGSLTSSDYTDWSSSDYILWPYNYSANNKPITKLIVDEINGSQQYFFAYRKGVKVVGIAGYSVTPPDVIVQATKIQALRWFMRAKQGYQDTGASANIGGMVFTTKLELDPDVKQLLAGLKLELSNG